MYEQEPWPEHSFGHVFAVVEAEVEAAKQGEL